MGGSKQDGDGKIPPVAEVKSGGPFAHAAAVATPTAPTRREREPPTGKHRRRHWRRRPLWQAPAERKETPFEIPWRHRSRFRLRGFQPLSRGGSLAPPLVRASTRT